METLKHWFLFIFSSEFRKKIYQEELKSVRRQIESLERSIPGQYERVRQIHSNPVDAGSEYEQRRRRRRYAEIKEDKNLLDRCRSREKKLKKKLGLEK